MWFAQSILAMTLLAKQSAFIGPFHSFLIISFIFFKYPSFQVAEENLKQWFSVT